jgi:tRNA (cmo5U34)-methyltransferase
MPRDRLYKEPRDPIAPFQFDAAVVNVFDDMLRRSIPLYEETIRRQAQLIERYYQDGTRIYDLGCSNGNLGMETSRAMGGRPFDMVALDSSAPMMAAYRERLTEAQQSGRIDLQCGDIRETDIERASVVALNFTLQFVPPQHRDAMIARIYDGLVPKGLFLFCEKLDHTDAAVATLQQSMYYGFKKENGYSDLEISQKREALEAILVPETLEIHLERIKWAGFRTVDVWLKWFNFAAVIAFK